MGDSCFGRSRSNLGRASDNVRGFKMLRVRCSALPAYFACPSSAAPCDAPYDAPEDYTRLGQAVHLAMVSIVRELDFIARDIAKMHDVDADQLNALVKYGRDAIESLRPMFVDPKPEIYVQSKITHGTPDVLDIGPEYVIYDYKSGYRESDYWDQLTGYAHAAREQFGPAVLGYRLVIVWLRLGFYEIRDLTDRDLDDWEQKFIRTQDLVGKAYNPGAACRFCKRQLECSARTAWLQQTSSIVVQESEQLKTSQERLVQIYPRVVALKAAIEKYEDALKELLRTGGARTLPDGSTIELTERTREDIIAHKAAHVLSDNGFDSNDIEACLKMHKGDVERIACDRLGGKKVQAKTKIMKALRAAGAVRATKYRQLEVSK